MEAHEINESFEAAVKLVNNLPEKPSDEYLLELYGLYKQSTVGDINIDEPSFWNFRDKAKWNAWKQFEGKLAPEAKKQYIYLAKHLHHKLSN